MRKNPGFTAVAVLSLALGIGANLAVISALYRLVLTKLPVRDPDRLYQVTVVGTDRTGYRLPFPQFEVMRANFDVFKPLFGWGGFPRDVTAGDWKGNNHRVDRCRRTAAGSTQRNRSRRPSP